MVSEDVNVRFIDVKFVEVRVVDVKLVIVRFVYNEGYVMLAHSVVGTPAIDNTFKYFETDVGFETGRLN